MLLTIGIFTLLVGGGLFYVVSWRPQQAHIEAKSIVADGIREIRGYAISGRNTENWILTFSVNGITLNGQTSGETITYSLPAMSRLAWQGTDELIFSQSTGLPNTEKEIILTTANLSTTFLINSYGILDAR